MKLGFYIIPNTHGKNIPINETKKERKGWITQEILYLIKQRDNQRIFITKSPQNVLARKAYKTLRNRIDTLIKRTKSNYYKYKISEYKSNIKKLGK